MRFDRLLDLTYASQLDQIEEALKALDKRLSVQVESCTTFATGATPL
jgi:GTP cyclohydrolase III